MLIHSEKLPYVLPNSSFLGSEATDLSHHLSELGLGDVRHARVDDVYHLLRFDMNEQGRITQQMEKEKSRKKRARETCSRCRDERSGFGNELHLYISTPSGHFMTSKTAQMHERNPSPQRAQPAPHLRHRTLALLS